MAYTPHTWTNGELITAEKLNAIEEAIKNEQVVPKGEPGDGLTGHAVTLTALSSDADAATVLAKVNEIVTILNTRGISSAPAEG